VQRVHSLAVLYHERRKNDSVAMMKRLIQYAERAQKAANLSKDW
jgi:hypothetical protein